MLARTRTRGVTLRSAVEGESHVQGMHYRASLQDFLISNTVLGGRSRQRERPGTREPQPSRTAASSLLTLRPADTGEDWCRLRSADAISLIADCMPYFGVKMYSKYPANKINKWVIRLSLISTSAALLKAPMNFGIRINHLFRHEFVAKSGFSIKDCRLRIRPVCEWLCNWCAGTKQHRFTLCRFV